MRTSMAYFAGVGTVIVAVGAGLGGGMLIANIVHPPKQSADMTKLEHRMSSNPIPMANAPSEPAPSVAATEPSAPVGVPMPAQNPPQAEPANAASTPAPPAGAQAATNAAASTPPAPATPQPAAPP